MKLQILMWSVVLWLCSSGCGDSDLTSITPEEINALLAQVDEDSPQFVEKNITFDSIVTKAGTRHVGSMSERVKIKLFYFNDLVRGYFNLIDKDDKNLQFFGQKIGDRWVMECVTKLNMEEVGGYLILDKTAGIWSNGNISFRPESITLHKSDIDYSVLKSW